MMEMFEFYTTVKNGVIQIPPEYQDKIKDRVRVILLPEGEKPRQDNFIDWLLHNPVRVLGFHPLSRDETHDR